MPLVECPQCQHRVSSVASACPKCGHQLGERCWDQIHRTDLIKCVKCKELVAPGATVCRNCGVLDPTDHRLRRSPVKLAAIALIIVGLIVGVRSYSQTEGSFNPLAGRSGADAGTADVADTAQNPPDAATAAAPTPNRRTEPLTRVVPASAIDSTDSLVKWTNTWVNVRSGRSIDTPVVLTLDPRERLEVGNFRRGWWAAYVDGKHVGYVANSVLADQPSDSLRTTQ